MYIFRRLKINHESHEFILDPGTVMNSSDCQEALKHVKCWLIVVSNNRFVPGLESVDDDLREKKFRIKGTEARDFLLPLVFS